MKIIIEDGQLDRDGNRILVEGISIQNPILMTLNFEKDRIVGMCDVFKEEGSLVVELNSIENNIDGFPCIGIECEKSDVETTSTGYLAHKSVLKEVFYLSNNF